MGPGASIGVAEGIRRILWETLQERRIKGSLNPLKICKTYMCIYIYMKHGSGVSCKGPYHFLLNFKISQMPRGIICPSLGSPYHPSHGWQLKYKQESSLLVFHKAAWQCTVFARNWSQCRVKEIIRPWLLSSRDSEASCSCIV